MIYLPIEIQLKMLREDLEIIKDYLTPYSYSLNHENEIKICVPCKFDNETIREVKCNE